MTALFITRVFASLAFVVSLIACGVLGQQQVIANCPDYSVYARRSHGPYAGDLELPYQRPPPKCRTFQSECVEKVIAKFRERMADVELARLFENCFPNALDTTIRWKPDVDGSPRTFVITGDIRAMWMRDSRYQVYNYMKLAPYDDTLKHMLKGVINTQAEFLVDFPYCNAMQPPLYYSQSLRPDSRHSNASVFPPVDYSRVFECKYELDSIASFFGLSADYYEATEDLSFIDKGWIRTARTLYNTLRDQQIPTFAVNGSLNYPRYQYQALSSKGSETLWLDGMGNPVNDNNRLVRSAFRPSDDATIFQYFIPGNALLVVELRRAADMLLRLSYTPRSLPHKLDLLANDIETDIYSHGVFEHPRFGKVFAYEVDCYGSVLCMDDSNVPSLLSLSDIGFLKADNKVYQNTREMILSRMGNPYFGDGPVFGGIGSPHIGADFAWPMSHIIQIRTSDDDSEIMRELQILKESTGGLGLMHESIKIDDDYGIYTRPWFAWVNSEFARMVIDLAHRKPHLIFDDAIEGETYDDIFEEACGDLPGER